MLSLFLCMVLPGGLVNIFWIINSKIQINYYSLLEILYPWNMSKINEYSWKVIDISFIEKVNVKKF